MQKPIALATSVALLFTGCHTKSPTWRKVMATPRATGDAENRDRAYAAELHAALGKTPHKVVTYEFDYFSRYRGSQTGQRTAIFYYDAANKRQPWWVIDAELEKPIWVPNQPLPEQVSFFSRRPARVVEVHDYTVSRDKVVHLAERHGRPVGTSTLQRVERSSAPVPVKVKVKSAPATSAPTVEESHESRSRWRLFGPRRAAQKDAPVTTLEPSTQAKPAVTAVEPASSKVQTTKTASTVEKKQSKPSPQKEPATKSAQSAATTETEKAKAKPVSAPESPANSKTSEAPKPTSAATAETKPKSSTESQPPTDPKANGEKKKRPTLFNREKTEPEPATPPPTGNGAAEPPRRNFFQRILSSLNPARWFRKTA